MPISIAAFSPSCFIFCSISTLAFSTISSIRTGWIRPSETNFSNANFAISLLTGSKQDRTTASGVSSIIKSTPVNVSNVLIFLPSRPIMRPFISSEGKLTVATVDSITWSIAHLCITVVKISLAFSFETSLIWFSFSRIKAFASCCKSFFNCSKRRFFASSEDMPDILSSSCICFCIVSAK